jgi:hypothetical protein
MGIFGDLFSTKPAEDAAKDKIAGLNNAVTQANGTLDTAATNANSLYGQAGSYYTPLVASTTAGSSAYGDATGANGAEGLARAKALYQSDPGYSGGLTTGIDQVARTAAQRGDLGGGNTSADMIKFASDYDNSKYTGYVNALAPYLGANANAVSGAAGVKTGQAGVDTGIAGMQSQNQWNAQTGIGNANADADLAKYSASSNFWSALMGGAGLALKASGIGGFAPGGK